MILIINLPPGGASPLAAGSGFSLWMLGFAVTRVGGGDDWAAQPNLRLWDKHPYSKELVSALESAIIRYSDTEKGKARLIYGRGTTIAGSATSGRRFKEALRDQGILPRRGEIPVNTGIGRTDTQWGGGEDSKWWGGGWESASSEESIKGLTRYLASGRNVVGLGNSLLHRQKASLHLPILMLK